MFYDELKHISWEDTTREIASKTARDVEIALTKDQRDVSDFMALISPAAIPYLEQIFYRRFHYRRRRACLLPGGMGIGTIFKIIGSRMVKLSQI